MEKYTVEFTWQEEYGDETYYSYTQEDFYTDEDSLVQVVEDYISNYLNKLDNPWFSLYEWDIVTDSDE